MKIRVLKKIIITLGKVTFCLFFLFQLYVFARLYLFASCVIPTWSMSPTLISGDYIIASLQIPGRREWQEDGRGGYTVRRDKGSREVRVGDVVVFNFPYARSKERMMLCDDLFYCKRCAATPGQEYRWRWKGQTRRLYLPAKGDEIRLDSTAWRDYRRCIEYETRLSLSLRDDTVLLGDSAVHTYRFRHDYYFMQGDNVFDSYDSRFWGPLPDDFILGVGKFIWFSRDPKTGEIRWKRMFKSLHINDSDKMSYTDNRPDQQMEINKTDIQI